MMAQNLTNYSEKKLLAHSVGQAHWTAPTATYLALFTTTPTEADYGVEVLGGGYVRQRITWAAPLLTNEDQYTITNLYAITFPAASDPAWGEVVALGVTDHSYAGNIIWYGPLDVPRTISVADIFEMQPGELVLELK